MFSIIVIPRTTINKYILPHDSLKNVNFFAAQSPRVVGNVVSKGP